MHALPRLLICLQSVVLSTLSSLYSHHEAPATWPPSLDVKKCCTCLAWFSPALAEQAVRGVAERAVYTDDVLDW
jgi:hypothetical protein